MLGSAKFSVVGGNKGEVAFDEDFIGIIFLGKEEATAKQKSLQIKMNPKGESEFVKTYSLANLTFQSKG